MTCITPIKLRDTGNVVPCGYCNFCLSRRRSDWSVRLHQHYMRQKNAFFMTFTYSDKNLKYGIEPTGTLCKNDIMMFQRVLKQKQKRLIKKLKLDEKEWKISYYTVGEYGSETRRPHYHAIMFNLHAQTVRQLIKNELWKHGIVHAGTVTHASINYVTKYVIDRDQKHEDEKPFSLMSKGLGAGYLESNTDWHRTEGKADSMRGFIRHNGRKVALPRYYKEKLFSKEEREYMFKIGVKEMDDKFFEELDRLEKFGVYRPLDYIEERKQLLHDQIRVKSLKLNTI